MTLEIPMIGDLLKSKREKINISIDKVSQKTKINPKILRAIEENNFSQLPGPAYIKGFVLSYARVIHLDQNEATNSLEMTYQKITGKPFPALNHTVLFKQKSDNLENQGNDHHGVTNQDVVSKKNNISTKNLVIVSLIVGLLLVLIGVYKLVTKVIYNEVNNLETSEHGPTFVPSSEIVKAPPVPVPAQIPEDETSEDATIRESKTAPPPPIQPTPIPLHRMFPKVEFKKAPANLFEMVSDAPENSDSSILTEEIKARVQNELENVYIKAVTGNTWLSYKIDKQPIVSRIIEKDKDLFIQGKEILVFLGNVAVTKIFYNNKLINTPTTSGVKSLIFPAGNYKDHSLPLFPKATDDILYTAEEYQKRMLLEEQQIQKAEEEKMKN